MCGRAFAPRFLWMWPNARISVMGGEQAAGVLATVQGATPSRPRGKRLDQGRRRPPSRRRSSSSTSARAIPTTPAARLWDDGIIDPCDTRMALALGISSALNAPIEPTRFGVFRM